VRAPASRLRERNTAANHDLAAAISVETICGNGALLPITADPCQRTAFFEGVWRLGRPKSRQFPHRGSGALRQASESTHAIIGAWSLPRKRKKDGA
jgi:hypothetical protein